MALDEFFGWYAQEPRPGFTKATVSAWRVTLEERGLGVVLHHHPDVGYTQAGGGRRRTTVCWRRSWPPALPA